LSNEQPHKETILAVQKPKKVQRNTKSRLNMIPFDMTHEALSIESIKNEHTYFDKFRTIKIESGDPTAFKVLVAPNHKEIYLSGMKGLSCIMFDAYSGTGKAKFNQKQGNTILF
jgi:hypothetical protein